MIGPGPAMPTLLELSPWGWAAALAVGLALGGVVFWSMKAEAAYVLARPERQWLLPVLLIVRLAVVGAALVAVVLWVPKQATAGAVIAGLAGLIAARIVVTRFVKSDDTGGRNDEDDDA